MNEKTKKTLSYVLSILIVGSITICIVVEPQITFTVIGSIALGVLTLLVLTYLVLWLKELLYDFFSSHYFQKVYRKYISKHYESRSQLLYYRGSEICTRCGKDCVVKYPLREYSVPVDICNKSVNVFIEECKLIVD